MILVDVVQGLFDDYVGASLLWMKINVVPIVSVEDAALVQVSDPCMTVRFMFTEYCNSALCATSTIGRITDEHT